MSLVMLFLLGLAQTQRAPVPEPAVQKEKEKLVREVFKSEYAKKAPSDRVALAKRLLQQGVQTGDDNAAKYVLLREAMELATSSGDPGTGMEAAEAIAKTFEVDGVRLKLGVLMAAAKDAQTPETARAAADSLLKLAEEALETADPETGEKAAGAAASAARKAKDIALAVRAEAKQKAAGETKVRLARAKVARETLLNNPDDPAANLEMGQYECFIKGNWDAGLPLLAKGSNEALKDLASRDLSRPEDVQEQIGLGDAWKERAEKELGSKGRLRERALYWYEAALPRVSGLTKVKVEKSIAALLPGGVMPKDQARIAPEGLIGWWRMDEGSGELAGDASGRNHHGKLVGTTEWVQGQNGKALRFGGTNGQVVVADTPVLRLTGDLTIALWFRKDEQYSDWARLVGKGDFQSRNYGIFAGGQLLQDIILFQQWEGEKKVMIGLQSRAKIEIGKWQHVAVTIRGDEVALYVGGQVDAVGKRFGAPPTSSEPLTFGFAGFNQVFRGALDDVRIYQRALSEQEIRALSTTK